MPEKEKPDIVQIPLSTDPASGKFIVADILPPKKPNIHTAAQRAIPPKKAKPLRETPAPRPVPPRKETGNVQALDVWFRKEQTGRVERKSTPLVAKPLSLPKKKRYLYVFTFLFVLIIAGGYGVSYVFSSLQVDIKLKTVAHTFNKEKLFVAEKTTDPSTLPGERIDLTDSVTGTFKASGTDNVRAKAKGIVSIYNAFNTSSQALVANTRLEAPDGKIYRLRESVTIPAAVIENGVLSPRSIDVTMYADQPGPEYNRALSDFTIPGFKNSPRYEGFYARSKTPVEGGYIGTATIVTPEDIDTARGTLESQLKMQIMSKATGLVPEGFLLLDDAVEVTADSREFSAEAGDVANEFMGTIVFHARALVFRQTELTHSLAKKTSLDPSVISLHNPNDLSLTVERRNMESGILTLLVTGDALFVWNLDANELANHIAEIPDPNLIGSTFQTYTAIDSADVRFKPSWIRKVPHNPARIKINTSF